MSEVAELTRLLAESRARFADSEARRAELEAVIDHVRRWNVGKEFLTRHPSVVLEDRDREVAARALEDFADEQFGTVDPVRPPWASEVMIRSRAAAIRKGDA